MRDRFYPWDVQALSPQTGSGLLGGHISLHLLSLKFCCGTNDIMTAVILAFLTVLRLYTVISVFSYYKKAKRSGVTSLPTSTGYVFSVTERLQTFDETKTTRNRKSSLDKGQVKLNRMSDGYEYIPRHTLGITTIPRPNFASDSKQRKHFPYGQSHNSKPLDHQVDNNLSTSTTTTSSEQEITPYIRIYGTDMPKHMQQRALISLTHAITSCSTEKQIAESVKRDFDSLYGATWHCIIGRNWSSAVASSKQYCIKLVYKDLQMLLYKITS